MPEIEKLYLMDIAIIGSTTIDRIVQHRSSRYKLGGVTTYSGLTYRRHRLRTAVVTRVAEPDAVILDILKKRKIAVYNGRSTCSTHFVNFLAGDGRTQEVPSRADPITGKQIRRVADTVACLHLGPLHPEDIAPDALRQIDRRHLKILLDVQGYVRRIEGGRVFFGVSDQLSEALTAASIVKADKPELESVLACYRIGIGELMDRFDIDELVVTNGEKGGWIRTASGKEVRYRAVPVEKVMDSTGAGDVFFAAYIAGRIFRCRSIRKACTHAADVAARLVKGNYLSERILDISGLLSVNQNGRMVSEAGHGSICP